MDYLVNPKVNANFLIMERHTGGIDNTGEGDRGTSQEYCHHQKLKEAGDQFSP